MQVFIYCKITLHVLGVHRTHHQEYVKLLLQPLVQVIVSEQQPSSNICWLFHRIYYDARNHKHKIYYSTSNTK
jgi:hypothetical protein